MKRAFSKLQKSFLEVGYTARKDSIDWTYNIYLIVVLGGLVPHLVHEKLDLYK